MSNGVQETEFKDSPSDQARRWQMELSAAKEALTRWHKSCEEIDAQLLDKRDSSNSEEKRLNLYPSNVATQHAMMYGKTPTVSVDRRFADAQDDIARVGAEILERLLNSDIERDSDTSEEAYGHALFDFLANDFGLVWLRYVPDIQTVKGKPAITDPVTGAVQADAVPESTQKVDEDIETDYVHWRDVLWSPCRVHSELTWIARKAQMTRTAMLERFGDIAKTVPLNSKKQDEANGDAKKANPWARADVWEIWSKEDKKVYWYVEGHNVTLDVKDDPLGLDGFWPCPNFLVLNATTSSLVPLPEYVLHQDQYRTINTLETRIACLEDSIGVKGGYDKTNDALKRLLTTTGNVLIPVDNWALHAEKGGLRGVVDWFPLEQVVNALTTLRDVRAEKIELLNQISGMSDIMRGQAAAAGTSATEQSIKAKFGSVRMQHKQDRFARFITEAQRLKAEIIAKHFDAKTILERCNCQFTQNAQMAPQAVDLLKSSNWLFRIVVKPEAVSLTDFSALKQESLEVLGAIGQHLQALQGLMQFGPMFATMGLELLQTSLAGLKGGSRYEALLDKYVAQFEQQQQQPKQPPPPDPKLLAQQMKGQQDMAKIQAELQADAQRAQIDVQTEQAKQRAQTDENTRELIMRHRIDNAMKPPEPIKPGFPR
jgi:hypothetical protein